jgi:hypothetical protein
MRDIVVQRHGDRWAVQEADAASASQEFETRDAAEGAARDLAAGGRVEVREDDTSGLGQEPSARADAGEVQDPSGVPADERARSTQSGLYPGRAGQPWSALCFSGSPAFSGLAAARRRRPRRAAVR